MSFTDRLAHAWNAFTGRDPTRPYNFGMGYSSRPDRVILSRGNERSMVTSIYNRISVDCSQIEFRHVKLDENKRYIEDMDSSLNYCLSVEANIDQTAKSFIHDAVMSMLDEGVVAIAPIDTTIDPNVSDSYKIDTMRVGKIVEWFPEHVKVRLYNDRIGKHQEIIMRKKDVSIVENPFYAVMNQPNSTAQRLMRKLALLDIVDENNGANRLDLIIQLPYVVKSEQRRQQAKERLNDIEMQLANSKYGVAYTDGTEHITQLNRSVDNQLLSQIESLTKTLYAQLGITEEIMNGSATEEVMNNYYSRTLEPILTAIADEMKRKFLTKTARTQNQSIQFFRDPFKLIPTSQLAEICDKFTRNEVMTSNEIRQIVGMKPAKDPHADELRNKNLSPAADQVQLDADGNVIPNTIQPEEKEPEVQ